MQVDYYTQISPTGASTLRVLLGDINSSQECIDYIEYLESQQLGNFCLYSAIKYPWRLGVKSDAVTKDLDKCFDYLNRYASRIPSGDRYWLTTERLEMTLSVID